MLLAGVRDCLAPVALGEHYHRSAMILELIHIWVHSACGGRSHRAARHSCRGLCWSGVIDRMVLHVLRHLLSGIKTCLDLGVCDVAAHDYGSVEAEPGTYRILRQLLADLAHRTVEIHLHDISLTCIAEFLRDEFIWFVVHLLYPYAVFVDLRLDVPVGGAAHTESDRAACAVARQSYHAYVVSHILSSELGAETYLAGLLKELLLELDVTESPSRLVSASWKSVIIVSGCELYGEKVLLSGSSAHYYRDVIWRAGSSSESLHLLHEERHERTRILDARLGLLIEIGLVCAASALGHAEEAVLHTLGSLDVYLCREVALGVDLVVHVQRGVLGITEILLGVSLVDTKRKSLLVTETGPYLLALLSVYDGGTGVLAER